MQTGLIPILSAGQRYFLWCAVDRNIFPVPWFPCVLLLNSVAPHHSLTQYFPLILLNVHGTYLITAWNLTYYIQQKCIEMTIYGNNMMICE